MAYIIAEPCISTKDTACVDVCPVDCIHPRKDEANFADVPMLYIDPVECIDCGEVFESGEFRDMAIEESQNEEQEEESA